MRGRHQLDSLAFSEGPTATNGSLGNWGRGLEDRPEPAVTRTKGMQCEHQREYRKLPRGPDMAAAGMGACRLEAGESSRIVSTTHGVRHEVHEGNAVDQGRGPGALAVQRASLLGRPGRGTGSADRLAGAAAEPDRHRAGSRSRQAPAVEVRRRRRRAAAPASAAAATHDPLRARSRASRRVPRRVASAAMQRSAPRAPRVPRRPRGPASGDVGDHPRAPPVRESTVG